MSRHCEGVDGSIVVVGLAWTYSGWGVWRELLVNNSHEACWCECEVSCRSPSSVVLVPVEIEMTHLCMSSLVEIGL
jgi:hypothetical protein